MAKPGYGYAHEQARKRALAVMVDGTRCPFCGKPMYRSQRLDLDHTVPTALGGVNGPTRLSHSSCNRANGARLGNAMRRANYAKRPMLGRRVVPKAGGSAIRGGSSVRRTLPKW